jgi:hypothetical protein
MTPRRSRSSTALRRALAGALLALLATGCGAIRFQRAWAAFDAPVEPAGMQGRWVGEWRSAWNGHQGGLRCLLTRADELHYRADFFSTYASLLYFRYQTVFHVLAAGDGTLRFRGRQDLGALAGGLYRYEGTVTGDRFEATFEAENGDHGVFEMRRVP